MNTPTPPRCLNIEKNDVTRSMIRPNWVSFRPGTATLRVHFTMQKMAKSPIGGHIRAPKKVKESVGPGLPI